MTDPLERFEQLGAGPFRTLTWGHRGDPTLFLHGLSGVAEVWGPTVSALSSPGIFVAVDQRGHGQSPRGADLDYRAGAFVRDTAELIRRLGTPLRLVGHSMGARVAFLLAVRHPELVSSVAIVDIGPEASKSNIAGTVRGLAGRPASFANEAEALAFAFRSRTPTESDKKIFLARLRRQPDGSLTWFSSTEVLAECVRRQRGRAYWQEWRRISVPALFVHGGTSNEVSDTIAARMKAENPRVHYERLEGIGHNIPLIAPQQLAELLDRHWQSTPSRGTY